MGSVNVRVRHDDDFMIAELRGIKILLPDSRTKRGNHGDDFLMRKHLVVAGFLDVEKLTFDWQNGLRAPVSTLVG